MSDTFHASEFVSGYLAEANDLISAASTQLLAVETAVRGGGANARGVREAFRALHTIKGLSGMVGVDPVVAIAHRLESALRAADQRGGRIDLPALDALLKGIRAIELRVRAFAEGKPVPAPSAALLEALDAIDAGAARETTDTLELDLDPALLAKLSAIDKEQLVQGLAAGKGVLRADFAPSPTKAEQGISITWVREQVKAVAEIVKVLPLSVPPGAGAPGGLSFALLLLSARTPEEIAAALPGADLAVAALAAGARPAALAELGEGEGDEPLQRGALVRVEVSRLDEAMDRLSALIVTRFRMARAVADLAAAGVNVRELSQIVVEHARQLRDLRAAVLHVRMVPVADVLERVPLLVRGLRSNTGKLVRLEVDTGRTEVDKAVAEKLSPAIVHLVRNAVDHAIEPPAQRKAAGKPEEGTLRILCHERANNQLEIAISDDGRGIDGQEIARRAGRPLAQTSGALLDLLCLPGLSTRDEVTTTSGRGMGMDIVRRTVVDQLGGELLLATTPGQGTTFTLRVPLTITIVDAFTFECEGQRFVVPVSSIDEVIDFDPRAVLRGPGGAGGGSVGLVERRGQALPLLQLSALVGLAPGKTTASKALVVRRAGEALGFAVHRMIGQQEVVIRPLEDALTRVVGVTGATDLGDGKPTLVLDLVALGGHALARLQAEAS